MAVFIAPKGRSVTLNYVGWVRGGKGHVVREPGPSIDTSLAFPTPSH